MSQSVAASGHANNLAVVDEAVEDSRRNGGISVKIGATVSIVLKADQRTGKRTEGTVARLLTSSPTHPHGIKVMLEDGQVCRVQEILEN